MKNIQPKLFLALIAIAFTLVYCKKDQASDNLELPEISLTKSSKISKTLSVSTNSIMAKATGTDAGCGQQLGKTSAALREIVFGDVPSSVFYNFSLTEPADIEIFAQDCCIRDDVVEVYVNGCLVRSIDSREGDPFTHPGETFTVTLPAGDHEIEYRNVLSNVSASGWYVSETEMGASTLTIGTCDTGVPNYDASCGNSLLSLIQGAKTEAKNHGAFVSAVAHLTNSWVMSGIITEDQKGAIMSCVAKSK